MGINSAVSIFGTPSANHRRHIVIRQTSSTISNSIISGVSPMSKSAIDVGAAATVAAVEAVAAAAAAAAATDAVTAAFVAV